MPSDLTGAEIDAIQDRFATDGDPTHDDVWTLIDYARSVPARIASARQEGYREGIEAALAAAVSALPSDLGDCYAENIYDAIRSLSPPPAEPSDGWIEWEGGECPAPGCVVEIRQRRHEALRRFAEVIGRGRSENYRWTHRGGPNDIIAYRIVKPAEPSDEEWLRGLIAWCRPGVVRDALDRYLAEGTAVPDMTPIVQSAEPSAPVAPDWPTRCAALEADGIAARKRVAALEAENAKLRERNEKLVEGLRPFAEDDVWHASIPDEFRALNPRYTVGDLRRARALLQGGADAG